MYHVITVTSYERHDVSDHRPLHCLFNCLFGLTTYKQRSSHYWSCEGNFQCIPTSGLYWCQCISNRMSMHHTKKHFLVWSIDQISVPPNINHHGHYPSYCRRHVVNLINQGTLHEILDELHLRPLASSILKDALTYINAFSIHTRDLTVSIQILPFLKIVPLTGVLWTTSRKNYSRLASTSWSRVWIEDALTDVNASFLDDDPCGGESICPQFWTACLFKLFWWNGYMMLKYQYDFSVVMSKLHHLKPWKTGRIKF